MSVHKPLRLFMITLTSRPLLPRHNRSNKVVPQVYASIIDDVVNQIREKFEEEGLDEDGALVLRKLWEANLRLTRVAPFQEVEEDDIDPGLDDEEDYEETDEGYNVAAQNQRYGADGQGNGPYYGGLKGGAMENSLRLRGGLASDDDDEEFDDEDIESEDVKPFEAGGAMDGKLGASQVEEYKKLAKFGEEDGTASSSAPTRDARGALTSRNPGLKPNENGIYPGEEIIGSDLDDSDQEDDIGLMDDEDDEEQDDLAKDVMICVCDKVQRVKNKWKVTFKDGFIRANGKEYLFSRCTGEFEW